MLCCDNLNTVTNQKVGAAIAPITPNPNPNLNPMYLALGPMTVTNIVNKLYVMLEVLKQLIGDDCGRTLLPSYTGWRKKTGPPSHCKYSENSMTELRGNW